MYHLTNSVKKLVNMAQGCVVKKSVAEAERVWFEGAKRLRERGRAPSSDFLAGEINCVFSCDQPEPKLSLNWVSNYKK